MKIKNTYKKELKFIYSFIDYIYKCKEWKLKYNSISWFNILSSFIPWWKSISKKKNALDEKVPWINYNALKYLKKIIKKNMIVFEYGSGGSTIFFASKSNFIFSVEHDYDWFVLVNKKISECGFNNYHIFFEKPCLNEFISYKSYNNPDDYISSDNNYIHSSFHSYVSKIEEFKDEYFDIIFIDGRARPSCLKHSMTKIKKGGYIFLDNSELENYNIAVNLFSNNNWKKLEFAGPVPYQIGFSSTTVWIKK